MRLYGLVDTVAGTWAVVKPLLAVKRLAENGNVVKEIDTQNTEAGCGKLNPNCLYF